MKINLGSGYQRFPDFINVDGDKLTNPDYVINFETDDLPFETSSISEIKAHHILEHIGSGFFKLMQEMYRVCKDQAIIDIMVPHHRADIWYGDTSHVRFITIEGLRQYSKKQNLWHIETYQSSSGFGLRLDVDFEIIDVQYELYEHWKERFKSMSQEQCEEAINNYNNVIGNVNIKLAVIKE